MFFSYGTLLIFLLLQQILNYSQVSELGKHFVKRLSNLSVQSTLFVPDNNGLPDNQVSRTERSRISLSLNVSSLSVPVYVSPQTLSQRDIEFHLSDGRALPVSQLKNGSRIRTRVGSLTVLGVGDLLNPSSLVRFITAAAHNRAIPPPPPTFQSQIRKIKFNLSLNII